MSYIDEMELSFMFKALSDYNRIKIVLKLVDGEKCANSILDDFYITQPTLSHHMSILKESGIVNVRKSGKKQFYSINQNSVGLIDSFTKHLYIDKNERV